jgi:hypothetical protein
MDDDPGTHRTIRDELAGIVADAMYDHRADCPGISDGDTREIADAVLHWLGGLDPDATPELIRWHLRNDRAVIGELRADIQRLESNERSHV